MQPSLIIRKADRSATSALFRQVADLHRQEIPGGFISSLNPKFIQRIYRAVVRSENSFLILALDPESQQLVGFISGSTNTQKTLVHCLTGSGVGLILALLPNLISFRTVRRIFETVRYARTGAREELPKAEILNFCVDNRVQGKGIGRQLFTALQQEFKEREIARIKIVTGEHQLSAQRFYQSVKAQPAGDLQVHDNGRSVVFLYDIK